MTPFQGVDHQFESGTGYHQNCYQRISKLFNNDVGSHLGMGAAVVGKDSDLVKS